MIPFTAQQNLWDWLKAENRHHSAKPAPEVNELGKPLRWFPVNRAAIRGVRFGAKSGRSRRERLTNEQKRADRRAGEHQDRKITRRYHAAQLEALEKIGADRQAVADRVMAAAMGVRP